MPVPTQNKLVLLIAEAIAHYEGFYKPGTRAYRNNNAGNLRGWSSSLPKDKDGFDEFPTRRDGFLALYKQVEKNIFTRELSLNEFFAGKPGVYGGYAPLGDNNKPDQYAMYVESFLEDRGFYPLSRDHQLKGWWEEIQGQGQKEPTVTSFNTKEQEILQLKFEIVKILNRAISELNQLT